MRIERIGSRGTLFIFEDEGFNTCVYLISGEKYNFLIDTYQGPAAIGEVKNYIETYSPDKPLIIIYTHSHYDHTWGTCAFKGAIVIAHENCDKFIREGEVPFLKEHKELAKGNVELVFPDITFKDNLVFPAEGLELFYTPGHTVDSISCFDSIDKVLMVGDNLESPIPYLLSDDLVTYRNTLNKYLERDYDYLIASHDGNVNEKLLLNNINYITAVIAGDDEEYKSGDIGKIHASNLKKLGKF